MSNGFLPKSTIKMIDLAPYGGEGDLKIKGLTEYTTGMIMNELNKLAKQDGETEIINDYSELIKRYPMFYSMCVAQECVVDFPGKSLEHPILTAEELGELPRGLYQDILDAVMEASAFPLVQKDGGE